jgi:1,3-propanediol dehydrogenase
MNNCDAILAMAKASLQAGIAFSNAVLGLTHAMTHQVGGLLDLPIGEISAVLLPYVMRFNMVSSFDKFGNIATAMGVKTNGMTAREAAEQAILMVRELSQDLGIPPGLSAMGLPREVIPELSKNAISRRLFYHKPQRCGC